MSGNSVGSSGMGPRSQLVDGADAFAVPGRLAVEVRVGGEAPEVEVQVVLPGEADAPEGLQAVLRQLDAAVADERLGHAGDLAGILPLVLHGPRRRGEDRLAGLDQQAGV